MNVSGSVLNIWTVCCSKVSLRLDTSRNELLITNTVVSVVSCTFAVGGYIGALFVRDHPILVARTHSTLSLVHALNYQCYSYAVYLCLSCFWRGWIWKMGLKTTRKILFGPWPSLLRCWSCYPLYALFCILNTRKYYPVDSTICPSRR